MKSFAISHIQAGNLDPDIIDAAVFESLNGLGSVQDVRAALYRAVQKTLPAMENNQRIQESAGNMEKAQFLADRILLFREYIRRLESGDVMVFVGKGAKNRDVPVHIPAGDPIDSQRPVDAAPVLFEEPLSASTQEPAAFVEQVGSADSSMLPALALMGHATIRHKSKLMAVLPRKMQLWILKRRHRSRQRAAERM